MMHWRPMSKSLLLLIAVAVLSLPAIVWAAETAERTAFGVEYGLMKLVGGEHDYSNVDQHGGLFLRRGLGSRWSVEMAVKYGWVRPGLSVAGEDAGFSLDSGAGLYTVMYQPRLGALYHLAPGSRVSPHLGLSVGLLAWQVRDLRGESSVGLTPGGSTVQYLDDDGAEVPLHFHDVTATASLGADIFFSENFSLNLGARYHQLFDNDRDNIGTSLLFGNEHADANDGLLEAYVGLAWFFGKPDSDGDGIPNRLDACPDQAEDFDLFKDEDGCPDPDNDNDGVLDVDDQCPAEAEDRDGFMDADGCPDPDNDGDGIIDAEDACPDEAEDRDGFQDDDGCPELDNDGDGVPDALDQCPGTPADIEIDENGCPVVEEIRADLILEGVNFESGSDVLTASSAAALSRVIESLRAWPEVELEIQGHTDSSGGSELNRELSQKRADAVRTYLIESGIDARRLNAVGYGEDVPIADNETRAGRAANRRVELHRTDTPD